MKRIKLETYRSLEFPINRFYRNTIEEVIEILESASFRVEISDEKSEYDTLDDLKIEMGTHITHLNIKADRKDKPFEGIGLRFSSDRGIEIHCRGRSDTLDACWSRLCDTLAAVNRPLHLRVFQPKKGFLIFAILVVFSFVAGLFDRMYQAIMTGVIMVVGLYCIIGFRNYPVIVLDRKHEETSFWKRHGEKVVPAICGAVGAKLLELLWRAVSGH